VKEILGTAFSVGCTVEGRSPKDVCGDVGSGNVACYLIAGHMAARCNLASQALLRLVERAGRNA